MKKAVRAITIGDKLYNMERIHGKIVTYTSKYFQFNIGLDSSKLIEHLNKLEEFVLCVSSGLSSKYIDDYIYAIKQTRSNAQKAKTISDPRLYNSCCFLHSCFAKYRTYLKGLLSRGCEIEYQKICSPMLLLELEIKNNKSDSD